MTQFDVLVVGGGHAGIESSLASSRLGLRVMLLSSNVSRIGYMSCNPAVGGLAKGHMVREIDVLGGEMGFAADYSCIQFKRLNASKGPAVRGTRVQCDKDIYNDYMRNRVLKDNNILVHEGEVVEIILENGNCVGVSLTDGTKVRSKSTILTTGTFMNGKMFTGFKAENGGRVGDKASIGLSDHLRRLGFRIGRLKTGTPARLIKQSIDWSKTVPQYGDEKIFPFSFRSPEKLRLEQIACYLTRTTEKTHDIIRNNLDKSPMFCGAIEGVGPRYCPSIEDKVVRFADKSSHQTFLEPEGLSTDLIYLQGMSTSLPEDVQQQFLESIPGLESVKVARYGYAVEYDFVDPIQLKPNLECKELPGLFLAGQINGTSGYEEAAGQGLLAGINAAHAVLDRAPLILGRDSSYIGVLIDDLVTKGTIEPYRMFTSRAEYRLVLREDNTIDRLSDLSGELGLIKGTELRGIQSLKEHRAALKSRLSEKSLVPNEATLAKLKSIGSTVINKPFTFEQILRRSEIGSFQLESLGFELNSEDRDPRVFETVENDVKYKGYVDKQLEMIARVKRLEGIIIPDRFDFSKVKGLSTEEMLKLSSVRPRTIGQASRISGIDPSAIHALVISLNGSGRQRELNLG